MGLTIVPFCGKEYPSFEFPDKINNSEILERQLLSNLSSTVSQDVFGTAKFTGSVAEIITCEDSRKYAFVVQPRFDVSMPDFWKIDAYLKRIREVAKDETLHDYKPELVKHGIHYIPLSDNLVLTANNGTQSIRRIIEKPVNHISPPQKTQDQEKNLHKNEETP